MIDMDQRKTSDEGTRSDLRATEPRADDEVIGGLGRSRNPEARDGSRVSRPSALDSAIPGHYVQGQSVPERPDVCKGMSRGRDASRWKRARVWRAPSNLGHLVLA